MAILKKDPTRTTTLRRKFIIDMNKRMRKLSKDIRKLIVDEDVFGLEDTTPTFLTANRQEWKFRTNAQKIEAFDQWLKQAHQAGLLEGQGSTPWTNQYIESAYRKGIERSYVEATKGMPEESLDFFQGSKQQFMTTAFNQPEIRSKIQLLYTRAFQELKGITAAIDQHLSRTLAIGLTNGWGTRKIAREMDKNIATINRTRARVLARTEVIRAHAEGQLDSFELLGVEEVGIKAEWTTAGDDRVCVQCGDREGEIFTIQKARDLIPLHPNCRCMWLPVPTTRKSRRRRTL